MEQIIVTKPDSSTWPLLTKAAVTNIINAEQRMTLGGEDVVQMSVESAVKLNFGIRDGITIFGKKYFLNSLPEYKKSGTRKHLYSLTWESRQYDLLKPFYLDLGVDGVSISPDFALTGNLQFFMDVLINNACRVFGTGKWVLGLCPVTDTRTLTFSNEKCLAVLQRLCKTDAFNKEFEILEADGVCTLNIKDIIGAEHTEVYQYGKGNGLYEISRKPVSESDAITRLYIFGSNKNLKSDYRGFSQRLKIPSVDLSYIEDTDLIAAYGLNEGVKIFDNIFPHRTGTVSSIGSTVLEFIDSSMDFDLNETNELGNIYKLPGIEPKVHFNSGNLAGYQFLISYDHSTKKFTLQQFADERGQKFPDADSSAFQIGIGDEYVLLDIIQPQTYIDTAESELLAAGQEYFNIVKNPPVQYSQDFDQLYFAQKYAGQSIQNVFGLGDSVHIKDTDADVDKSIRVKVLKRNILQPYKYSLDLYDYKQEALLAKLVSSGLDNSRIISASKIADNSEAYERLLIKPLLNCLVIMNAGTENEYLRAKLPFASDGNIKAGTDHGQFPGSIWAGMPYASDTVKGGIIYDPAVFEKNVTNQLTIKAGVLTPAEHNHDLVYATIASVQALEAMMSTDTERTDAVNQLLASYTAADTALNNTLTEALVYKLPASHLTDFVHANIAHGETAYGWGDWHSNMALKAPLLNPAFAGSIGLAHATYGALLMGHDASGLYFEQNGTYDIIRFQTSKAGDNTNYSVLVIDPDQGFLFKKMGTGIAAITSDGAVKAASLKTANLSIEDSGSDVVFKIGGVIVGKWTAAGKLYAIDNILGGQTL